MIRSFKYVFKYRSILKKGEKLKLADGFNKMSRIILRVMLLGLECARRMFVIASIKFFRLLWMSFHPKCRYFQSLFSFVFNQNHVDLCFDN